MIKEYDVVKAAKNISELVSIGCIGTVVMIFGDPSPAYIVEFVNDANETIAVLTVKPDEIVSR